MKTVTGTLLRTSLTQRAAALMVGALAGLAGCASVAPTADDVASLSCTAKLQYIDHQVAQNDVRNVTAASVSGYPFLRANRNSVLMGAQIEPELSNDHNGTELFADWLSQMRDLDRAARAAEFRNLPQSVGITLDELEICADQLAAELDIDDYAKLAEAVFVPDDYLDFQRIAGLYPLTAFPAHFGYEGWKRDNLRSFDLAADELQQAGPWQSYGLIGMGQPADVKLANINTDSFGRLLPTPSGLKALVRAYAPIFKIRTESDSDKIGLPVLGARDALSDIDTRQPTIFYRLGHTYLNGAWHAQITYSVWFPERPATGMFDILAGHLDALIWRVTLDHDGMPLIADSIHGCGCYHLFFPGSRLQRIAAPEDGDIRETAESPTGTVDPEILARPVLWIDAVSHYLLAITARDGHGQNEPDVTAKAMPENSLNSLMLGDGSGYASLYDADGFVPGTDRLERFILWPLGIERPGAMRQWGHHATAFVGRRHFDDPLMFDRYFAVR